MLHEFINIVKKALEHQRNGVKKVLATVVHLDGSSYRKPGVRMLISEDGDMTGAVSGGCVEKEVRKRAQSVFKDNKAKIMTYDGRYRLGCEGILYILIEPFDPSPRFVQKFTKCIDDRESIQIQSYYEKEDDRIGDFGSIIQFKDGERIAFTKDLELGTLQTMSTFEQTLQPCFKLLIIGGEHDSVKLCTMASLLGWEVDVITSVNDPKGLLDFPGAKTVSAETSETISLKIDTETAVVLMTHNYVQDLKYLLKLESKEARYIGILGSVKRREQLQNELIHYVPELSETFLEQIYSPAGLNVGAITPEEIALSILSEILSVVRETESLSLRTVTGKIHI